MIALVLDPEVLERINFCPCLRNLKASSCGRTLIPGSGEILGLRDGRGRVNSGLQWLNSQHKQCLGMRSFLFGEPEGKHSYICSCNHCLV